MADTKTYRITDKAGQYVAGVRRPASGLIELTDAQAKHELRLGSIQPASSEEAETVRLPRKVRRR